MYEKEIPMQKKKRCSVFNLNYGGNLMESSSVF